MTFLFIFHFLALVSFFFIFFSYFYSSCWLSLVLISEKGRQLPWCSSDDNDEDVATNVFPWPQGIERVSWTLTYVQQRALNELISYLSI